MRLPPTPGRCQVCAYAHPPECPHNPESLYYQVAFEAKHGRYPTWTDAMAHCGPEMKRAWREGLVKMMTQRHMVVPQDLLEEGGNEAATGVPQGPDAGPGA
jgi:hypothetical protein